MFRDAHGHEHAPAASTARIVSLVPSITELLFALDLGDQVVGRTGFCIHPRDAVRSVPKLGGTKDVDVAALLALKPSHVIVNIDENTLPLFETLKSHIANVIVTHPNAPRDNLELYRLLGGIFSRQAQAKKLAQAFSSRLERVGEQARSLPTRRVLYLIWREPWMTVSCNTYIARMLELVNWQIVGATSDVRYPQLSAGDMQSQSVDLALLSSEPYPFRAKHLHEVGALCGPSTTVKLIDGEMLSWYGNRAIAGVDYLARLARDVVEEAA